MKNLNKKYLNHLDYLTVNLKVSFRMMNFVIKDSKIIESYWNSFIHQSNECAKDWLPCT